MNAQWTANYPHQAILRQEINGMLVAYKEAIFEHIPKDEIRAIYFKGSANKKWDSLLDYVPEISDVDIHLHFYDDRASQKYLGTFPQCFDLMTTAEKLFYNNFKNPLHVPRPQLLVINDMLQQLDYIPSPKGLVTVVYGEEYHFMTQEDCERARKLDRQRLIELEDFFPKFNMHIIDKPAKWLWQSVRTLSWRVSPVASRVLSVLGKDPISSWSLNRTKLRKELSTLGEKELADSYASFYIYGWDFFLSEYRDFEAAKEAITGGVRALEIGCQIGGNKV